MSQNQVTRTSTPDSSQEERDLGNNLNEQLIARSGSEITNRDTEEKRRNFVSVTFSLLSVVLAFGGIAIPRWSVLVASSGEHLGEYGLFIVKILEADGVNTTHAVYQSLFQFYNPGELSLILCIILVLLFNLGLTISGIIVSLGFCPVYLNFLTAFSVFNVFGIFNYLAVMGLWLWVTDRIPKHNTNKPIGNLYPDVRAEFDYGYYIIIMCTGLLTVAAVANILDMKLLKNGCFRKKYSSAPTMIVNPRFARASLGQVLTQLPIEPPDYREDLSPQTSPLTPSNFPRYLTSANTSFIVN